MGEPVAVSVSIDTDHGKLLVRPAEEGKGFRLSTSTLQASLKGALRRVGWNVGEKRVGKVGKDEFGNWVLPHVTFTRVETYEE